ncbi:MAG: glycosyltransferase family 4 protein [Nevskiales bacterium]
MNGPICHINLARGFRGGERQTELLIRALAELGYAQRLIARKGEPLQQQLADLPGLQRVELSQPFLIKAAVCRGAAVVQVHEAKAGHLACIAHRLYGVPYVITRRVDKPPRASWLNRRLYANAAAVVPVSAMISGVLTNAGLCNNSQVIADAHSDLPVDSQATLAIRERFSGKFLLGHAGALVDRHKGQGTLIEAMHLLANDCPDLHLLLLGSGEDEALLKQKAQGLDNISFEGFTEQLGDYLAALDLFVYPSRFEGLGSVLLDAMQKGLPIVASDVGGIPEIVRDQHNGLLVPAGDAAALAGAIRKLYADAALRKRLAENGQQLATAYSPQAMARQYADLYRSL